jgi:hypothetical protein
MQSQRINVPLLKKDVELVQKKQLYINTGCGTSGVGLKNSDTLIDIGFL